MKNEVIKMVASQCPTTLEELKDLDGLGEQKFKDYGERLIKNIQSFVQMENLEHYLEKKRSSLPSKKRKAEPSAKAKAPAKAAKAATVVELDEEFPLDFEVDDIMLPGD